MEIKLGNRLIGPQHPPFIIAEMSGNHNQSLERALEIVDAAAKSGAHALKIQTYTPDTMTLDLQEGEFFIKDPKSLWKGKSLYDLYSEAMTPWEWHAAIKERCEKYNMLFFSTPFDATAVDFLETLNVDFYKIASFENTDLPLIQKVIKTGKPIIISTGMASVSEIAETVELLKKENCRQFILLKCTSAYPATAADANLLTIPNMREVFNCQVGLSDHTMGIGVALASIALGATLIEKHFTLKRADGGVDSAFSMEPDEFRQLVDESYKAWQSLGKVCYERGESETKSLVFRRSLYIAEDMKKGEVLNEKNLRAIRPGMGLAPKNLEILMGKKVGKDLKKGTPASWDILEWE